MDSGSELIQFLEDPKCHCGPPVRVGTYGVQVFNGVLVQVNLRVDSVILKTPPVAISPVQECVIEIDIPRNWHNSYMVMLPLNI